MAQANIHPVYTPPSAESSVKPAYAPTISPEMAAKNLGDKFPYSGGAMATHKPSAMGTGTHSYSNGMQGQHVMHAPRTQG